MSPELTPSQTVGSFFHDALVDEDRSKLVATGHPLAIRIEGMFYDGTGDPVPPLVKALTAAVSRVSEDAARYVHKGATSQDIVDAAAMLVDPALSLYRADVSV